MLADKKIIVVLPAYNAARTLERTYHEIPRDIVDDVILIDDASQDDTLAMARSLGIATIRHDRNRGYGGNQKTCYTVALARGADIVVMLHPDYQYSPKLVTAMASMIASELFDVVLASRILGRGALVGGMPLYKYVANRFLTLFENLLLGQKLSEYHTGYRAWSRQVLQRLPLNQNSDDFVFDNEMLAQCAYFDFRVGEISCPTKYLPDSSSINFRRGVVYGLGVLKTAAFYRLQRMGMIRARIFHDDADARLPALSRSDVDRLLVGGDPPAPTPTVASDRFATGRGILALALFGVAIIGAGLAWLVPGGLISIADGAVRALRALGPGGAALFGVLQVLVAVSGVLPASMLGVAAGATYGLWPGFLLASVCTMAGAELAFLISRSLLRPLVERMMATRPKLRSFDALVARDDWRLVCLLRISPVMPFSLTSYMLGLSSIGWRGYSLGTLASLPSLFGYVFIGALADAGLSGAASPVRWAVLGTGIIATLVLTARLGRIVRKLGFGRPANNRAMDL